MKKLCLSIAFVFSFSMLLCSIASADVIYPIASSVDPEHLAKTACYARITGYNENQNTLTVELRAPETFAPDKAESLQPGDSICIGGEESVIESVLPTNLYNTLLFNENEKQILLHKEFGVYYCYAVGDDYVWDVLAVIECPVTDTMLFLDYSAPEYEDNYVLPIVYTGRELAAQFTKEDDDALSKSNVYVVFDSEGNLATIQRYYVPWQ